MALIKWGALAVDGRGKLGGQVLSKNRTGNYIRNKVTPVNPRSSYQQDARQQLGSLSAQWKNLTEDQRQEWRDAVELYKTTNVFGDQVKPTGKNLFVGLNRNLLNIGQGTISSPVLPIEFEPIQISSVEFLDNGTETVTLADDLEGRVSILIYATPPLSPGVNFVESEFRMIGSFPGQASGGPIDLSADYTARFGVPSVGMKVFVRVVLVSDDSGQRGVFVQDSTIVAEAD